MSHPEQLKFVLGVKERFPKHFEDAAVVLEVGSRDVNGSVRQFFAGCWYTGVDCTPGEGVDRVCLAHEFVPNDLDGKPIVTSDGGLIAIFDTVVSCEAFEHDPHLEKTLWRIRSLLKPGGLFVGTWASPDRQEHGTARSTPGAVFGPDADYYKGLSAADFAALAAGWLDPLEVTTERNGLDVYALGFRVAD